MYSDQLLMLSPSESSSRACRVRPICGVERCFELSRVIANPVRLRNDDVARLWLMKLQCLGRMPGAADRRERRVAGAVLVPLENVTAGDGRFISVRCWQLGNIDAVLANFDPFEKH